jgi:hypothetical protein
MEMVASPALILALVQKPEKRLTLDTKIWTQTTMV